MLWVLLMIPGGDRYLIVAAYYLVASEHHSGQWSKGYAKLSQCCRMQFRPGLGNLRDDEQVREHAAALLWKRRREIRRSW